MDSELQSFVRVWSFAIISLLYSYYFSSRIPRGILRLLSLLPVFLIFILLPFHLSSFHLRGLTSFFLAWLANFNLILFSFDQGPLSPLPNNPFHFICFASLPIKIKQSRKIHHLIARIHRNPESNPDHPIDSVPRSVLFAVKVALMAALFQVYHVYGLDLHKNVILALYCVHVYLEAEILLAVSALPARAVFGFEIEKQFNEPYLATSLQDFWGRRWNLTVTGILRPTVYLPVRSASAGMVGPRWAALPGILSAFVVSGFMHELLYYYITRVPPTWEVTWFFVLQGICTAVEVAVKKKVGAAASGGWRLHRAVSGPLTVGFVAVTGVWLFLPQLVRNRVDEKAIGEYWMLLDYVKRMLQRN